MSMVCGDGSAIVYLYSCWSGGVAFSQPLLQLFSSIFL
ncbi:hypothetical protein BVRB_1g011140 [Beta vulgaris subsp. vulgaris]|nr:hypothetical protein BVRB_1g011140 [Beta vulgaris subsp. vulgaris]